MRARRGFTLVAVMWFAALVLTATLATHGLVGAVRFRLAHHRAELAASTMAVSGADYAQAMLRTGRWSSPRSFDLAGVWGGAASSWSRSRGPRSEARVFSARPA